MRKLTTSILLALVFVACGVSDTDDEDKKKGGDHVPEDTEYRVASSDLPKVPGGAGHRKDEYAGEPLLRKFVHVAERYQICVDPAEVTPEAFAAIQARLKTGGEPVKARGLESMVNYALANVDQFRPGLKGFSSRVTLDLVYIKPGAVCSFAVLRRPASAFPFNEPLFTDKNVRFLYSGRIIDRSDESRVNEVPIGYALDTLDTARLALAVQYLVASYMGLSESPSNKSVLNDDLRPDAAWQLDDLGPDYQVIFAYALAYRSILRPTDLSTFHHYSDTLGFTAPPTDPLLSIPAGSTPPRFVAVLGHNDLTGVRLAYEPFAICAANDAAKSPTEAQLSAALASFSSATVGSLAANLKAAEPKLELAATLAAAGAPCQLLVAFRDDTQYPFAGETFNGLYAHEGQVKDAAGAASPLPVIYLNMTNLAAEKTATDAKWLGYVLEHEAAHFMGLKHSRSLRSILSPSGYNKAYDLDGGDRALFAAWATEALKPR